MYDVNSRRAADFIDRQEAAASVAEADRLAKDPGAVAAILDKAAEGRGLSHREASVLMAADDPETTAAMFDLAARIKQRFYGNRIVLFAPLYLSNHCINGCVYCPYHRTNSHMPRKKLTQAEIVREVTALQDMGHKRLAVEAGEHPKENPLDYIIESIRTIYGIHHRNGAIRRVNVNIAATTVED
ncbi:MAG: [FeFe] hydrogenase H-cluster radical SAM maturase HydG, partial [Desulfovibrio sp.]|nr:[FeFe] hydrogenase H-cluster radical SAM maturase HydG [Desulfovibrio sp.]